MSGSPLVFEKFADGGLPRLNGGGVTLGGAAARHRAPQINHPSASPLAAPPMASRPTTSEATTRRRPAAGRPQTSEAQMRGGTGVGLLLPGGPTTNTPPRHRPQTTDAPGRGGRRAPMADAAPPRQRDLASVGEAWGFGQFPAAVDRSKGGLLDASGDEEAPADENVRLRGELQQLQLALQHTQSALVDRYRGGSHKTVGGAQFRMGDMGSRGVKAPIPPPQKCAECASVKLVLKKTRTEKDALAESLGVAESDLAISRDGHAATCREAAAATAEHREKLRDDLDELGRSLVTHQQVNAMRPPGARPPPRSSRAAVRAAPRTPSRAAALLAPASPAHPFPLPLQGVLERVVSPVIL
jgi:hypothetical protein